MRKRTTSDGEFRERRRKAASLYNTKNRNEIARKSRAFRRQAKKEAIEGYGGKCVCCDEAELCFLTLDHIYNDGAEYRKTIGPKGMTGSNLYRWAIRNNFPDMLQVLCWNCNLAKQHDPEGHLAAHPNAKFVHGGRVKRSVTDPPESKDIQLELL